MKKLLKPSDWLLLGLAGFLDIIEEVRDPLHLFSNYYQNIYGSPLSYRKSNYRHLVWRNLKVLNIEKTIIDGKPYLQLTQKGKENIKKKFPLLTLNQNKWDRKWRIVIFDIEEKNKAVRETFRRKLKELGFGQLQKSVWISPNDFLGDFKEYVETHSLARSVVLIETQTLITDDLVDFAWRIWKLEDIDKLYLDIYHQLIDLNTNDDKHLTKYGDRNKWLNNLKNQIISTYFYDPFLPNELLPPDWKASEVKKLIKELKLF